ncbi:MAG: cell wall metabolism sensor histidine kinase WalK [Clostridiales Family XIII bacterium]|jgi:two-component system sensor histidine kinase VicK|nr:cell wall metabolism sensor histidine kinase WalK [Clostridiales Family XIII bacterium]
MEIGIGILAATCLVALILLCLVLSLHRKNKRTLRLLEGAENSLAAENDRIDGILRNIADGVIAVDVAGNFVHVNPSAVNMFRLSEADIRSGQYDEIMVRHHEKLSLESLLEGAEGEEMITCLGRTLALRVETVVAKSGETEGVIAFLRDVTETQSLEDMQVDFVANVSHELKTPLTTIKTYAETLLSGGVSEEQKKDFVEIIDSEADRMTRLVKELLMITRMDHSQQKWYKKESDISALLRMAVRKMEITAKSKDIAINFMFDTTDKTLVEMDVDRIEQVVLNVLSNAIKYTDEGGRIDVDLLVREEKVRIIISDNGIGIPEKAQARVFDRFFRVDKARSRQIGGTGLGLSISKQIVEEHGGDIELESRFGKGTKVSIVLPMPRHRGERGIL